jgi:hypothetical protein
MNANGYGPRAPARSVSGGEVRSIGKSSLELLSQRDHHMLKKEHSTDTSLFHL